MEARESLSLRPPVPKRTNETAINSPSQRKRIKGLDDATESEVPEIIERTKFNTKEIKQHLNFKDLQGEGNYAKVYNHVYDEIERLLQEALNCANRNDVCIVQLYDNTRDQEVSERFCYGDNVEDLISNMLEKLVQSNSEIVAESEMELVVKIVHNPSGGGGEHRKLSTLLKNEIIRKKMRHLFVPVYTDNNLCFSTSLAFLLDPSYTMSEAEQKGQELHKSVGKPVTEKVCLSEIEKFEQAIERKIVVFWKTLDGYTHYSTAETYPKETLYLFLHEEHYYGIKNIKGFLGVSYVCTFCHKGYNRQNGHKCKQQCNVCLHPECPRQPKMVVKCKDCLRLCQSYSCFEQHKVLMERKRGNYSWCDLTKYCPTCNLQYTICQTKKTEHKCLTKKCFHCQQPLSDNHQCFIQPMKAKNPSTKLIFYDFETTQENGYHQANYVCAMEFDGKCWTSEGESCVADFFKHFRQKKYKDYTFIAHNARGFDAYLLIKYLYKELVLPKLTVQGSKVMCFVDEAFSQRYIDSLNFLPMKLSSLPSAFGFEQEKKGYFPHFFNTAQNQKYKGRYPEPHYYGDECMMPKERDEFYEWYNSVKDGVFDFRKEMTEYCKNDVAILRKACLRFREELINSVNLDPFRNVTIASLCMTIYQSRFLTKDTLALTYANCYIQPQKRCSDKAIEWLEYLSVTEGIHIQHALNEGEREVGGYFLDGYALSSQKSVGFEFLGCYYHACLTCYKPNDIHPSRKITFKDVHQECTQKLDKLKGIDNFELRYIWEHEWDKRKTSDQKLKDFLKNYDPPMRLNPREALYGGRTNALRLHYKAQEDEKIQYYDFTSLYPFVNKTKVYPTGQPEIIFDGFKPLQNYFGLIRAKVYPPYGLFLPVLPYRARGKLMFPLCRICCETANSETDCGHSRDERALTGVWTSVEMVKAVEKGYEVARLFEVWHFPTTSDTLFTEYVNTFLKGKQEASGYPDSILTDADRKKYIDDYRQHEKIELNPDNIKVNKAKRSLCKLALNSLWGKFAQRPNQTNWKLISDPGEFMRYVFSPQYVVSNLTFLNDDVALVQWKHTDDSSSRDHSVNIFIAAFTTAYARLELYDVMDRLQERVLYHDTDSIIFVSRPGEWMPETGDFLGQLTNELSADDHIVEFVSGGPKLYGYCTAKNKTCMKVKGITLNYTNQQSVNLESLTELIEKYAKDKNPCAIPTTAKQIAKEKKGFNLKNKEVKKHVRVVYDKRVLRENYCTLPYGYYKLTT